MADCRCECHTNPALANVHVCACTGKVRSASSDWFTEAVAMYKAQAEAGNNVTALVLKRARGSCPHCDEMLDINQLCPAGCLDLDGIDQAPARIPAVSGSKLHRGRR